MREETRCHHMGYSFRLTARVLLYAPSHRQDSTYQSFVSPVVEHWLEREIAHEGSIRRPIAPWANALTTELHLAPKFKWYTMYSHAYSHLYSRLYSLHVHMTITHTEKSVPLFLLLCNSEDASEYSVRPHKTLCFMMLEIKINVLIFF